MHARTFAPPALAVGATGLLLLLAPAARAGSPPDPIGSGPPVAVDAPLDADRDIPYNGEEEEDAAPAADAVDAPDDPVDDAVGDAPAYSTAWSSWRGDYETGNFSQFTPSAREGAPYPTISTAHVREGRYAGRYTVPPGGKRTEMKARDTTQSDHVIHFREGDERWFGFSVYLDPGFPMNQYGWQVLSQWIQSNATGAPPFEFGVCYGTSQFCFMGNGSGSGGHTKLMGTATTGRWVDWVVHVKFSSNPSVGYYEVWRDGQQKLSHYHPPGGTLFSGHYSYWKMGLYRKSSISRTGTVWNDAFRVGGSYAAVDPRTA